MNIFDAYLKSVTETALGRIRIMEANWVFEPTEAQLAKRNWTHRARSDALGHEMHLVKQQGVHCQLQEKGVGYPKSNDFECWYLPAFVCRKCEHHRKGKRSGTPRYPTCAWLAEQRASEDVNENAESAVKKAIESINEIMR